jgi:hypothetical protein
LILYDGAVPSAGEFPFLDLCARVQERIEGRYHVRVVTRDIPDPLIGDLNGSEIHIDFAVTPEQRLFLLAHLFGHTVQSRPGGIRNGQDTPATGRRGGSAIAAGL